MSISDEISANLSLPLLLPSQAQKHVTHNEALLMLDALVQLSVLDRDQAFAPEEPQPGARHIVPAGGGAGWGGPDHAIACRMEDGWRFFEPQPGWRAFVLAEAREVVWQEDGWRDGSARGQEAASLGVNTAADPVNRLAVSAAATLLTHAGAGHQLKINKHAAGETASLLFQSGWSGRAEMGLAGTDDFSVKLSADGADWTEALVIGTEAARLDVPLTGTAVTQSAADATAGRLLRVGDFGLGLPATASPVALSDLDAAAAQPTGLWRVTATTTGSWPAGVAAQAGLLRVERLDAATAQQILSLAASDRVFLRRRQGGVWQGWVALYSAGSLLGVVAQSGGLPTGAVIEQGTTPDGDYTRFADGTQICRQARSDTSGLTLLEGAFHLSPADLVWTFPMAFASPPVTSISGGRADRFGGAMLRGPAGVSSQSYRLWASAALTAGGAIPHGCLAIGRWY